MAVLIKTGRIHELCIRKPDPFRLLVHQLDEAFDRSADMLGNSSCRIVARAEH
ncbi:hypothetical protein D3C84_1027890 [compost metagenome]